MRAGTVVFWTAAQCHILLAEQNVCRPVVTASTMSVLQETEAPLSLTNRRCPPPSIIVPGNEELAARRLWNFRLRNGLPPPKRCLYPCNLNSAQLRKPHNPETLKP